MSNWAPKDFIELIQVIASFIATVCLPLATAYIMIAAHRSKRNAESIQEVSRNVDRLEKNTNSISERNQAIAQRLGITEGIAQERASVKANAIAGIAAEIPLPVVDERVTEGLDRVVEAIENQKEK